MSSNSKIEWTEATWNPVTGCTKISQGCKFCYAEVLALRLRAMGQARYANGFEVTLQEDTLDLPLRWREPRTIFVNSMSDLFHKDIPLDYITKVFATMARATQHTFQVLTKRSDRLREVAHELPWPRNVWMGVSVEDQKQTARVHDLATVPAPVRFLSVEPMLEEIPRLPLSGIHWVIVGGESGRTPRPMDPAWVRGIRDQCADAGVAFFFKQWGGTNKKKAGRLLDGRTYNELPDTLVRRAEQATLAFQP